MTLLIRRFLIGVLALPLALMSGCFLVPELEVSPKSISFGSAATDEKLTIENKGGLSLTWRIEEVVRANENAPWVAQDVPWLSVGTASGTTKGAAVVPLRVSRSGQPVGSYRNTGVRVISNGGTQEIHVSMSVAATLTANPSLLTLNAGATQGQFNVVNSGTQEAPWAIRYLPDPTHPEQSEALPVDIVASPNPGSTGAGQSTQVTVQWAAQRQSDFYLLVQSDAGSSVVSFLFGAVLEGLEIRPSRLTLYIAESALEEGAEPETQSASILRIGNTSAISRNWTAEAVTTNNPSEKPAISVAPATGGTPAGGLSEVSVAVTNPQQVVVGSGNYSIIVRSGDRFLIVPIVIEVLSLPEIAISEPPQSTSTRPEVIPLAVLDFGREDIQKPFWIANVGPRNSRLYFRVTHEDQGVENPVIADVRPMLGGANGEDGEAEDFFHPTLTNVMIDGVPITVTINRNNLTEDVEFRTITVEALDKDPTVNPDASVIDAVAAKTIQVRVERQPLRVEGALNRSRPPYVMRFVFLLRDSLSKVIPTATEEDRERIGLTISEDGVPLQLTETSYYVDGPDNLKVNLIVMLDYTGSMYYAGVDDTEDPLDPGEALARVKAAAKKFIEDLPPSYRVALMFYNDRQQQNRLIRAFTTDRQALNAALDAFSLPSTQVGASDIYDALLDGVNRLVAEDSDNTLPFDDADVRSIVFITDGYDNASSVELSQVTSTAKDNKVRLYPLGYSPSGAINSADLLVMAEDTGGHLYTAQKVKDLTKLLANEKTLTIEAGEAAAPDQVLFNIGNIGDAALTWQISGMADAPWITGVNPSQGTILPGGSAPVTVSVNPEIVSTGILNQAVLNITSNNGSGTATVSLVTQGVPPAINSLKLDVRDEPGTVWGELENQLVLTYLTPKQKDFGYTIRFEYKQDNGRTITGFFEENATAYTGDIRAGQVSMNTTGIYVQPNNPDLDDATRAEVFVRADYVPRDVNLFRMRFFLVPPDGVTQAVSDALLNNARMKVELASDGLLVPHEVTGSGWRLLPEGDGAYTVLTSRENSLPYGAFGNLFKITVTGLRQFLEAFDDEFRQPEFFIEMRLDNDQYVLPAAPGHPSETKYFLYPAGPSYPQRRLTVSTASDIAPSSQTVDGLAGLTFDPEASGAWDRDGDGIADFQDPQPENKGLPGSIMAPNPLNIGDAQDTAAFTIRNNRLDTFTWTLAPASLPDWISGVLYGVPPGMTPKNPLHPGESEAVTLQVDRTGLNPGTRVDATIQLDTDAFGGEELPVTLTVGAR